MNVPAPMNVPASISIIVSQPVEIQVHARLARAFLSGERAGVRRLLYKASRTLFYLVHQRLMIPARGLMVVSSVRDAAVSFEVNCANTAFLDYARRSHTAEGFEPEVSGLFSHLAPRVDVIYDIGANWGFYSLLFGTDSRFTGEVHAFEIRPQTAADLHHVVASAGLAERVHVHAYGLSDRDRDARLAHTHHSYLAHVVPEQHHGATEPVELRRVDGLHLPPPQLIKIDVEGHEAAVLRGSLALLDRHRPLIVLENWHNPTEPGKMLEPLLLLSELGYAFYRLIWRVDDRAPLARQRAGVVELVPVTLESRPSIPMTLNLMASHPTRVADFF